MTNRTNLFRKLFTGSLLMVALFAAVGAGLFFTSGAEAAARGERTVAHRGQGRGGHGFGRIANAQVIADTLGMTVEELQAARQSGQTLEEIAADQGVSMDTIADAVLAANEARLAEAVANGNITQEQADNIANRMEMHALARLVFDKAAFKAAIADLLNVSVAELEEAKANRTMKELVEAAGVTREDIQATVQAVKAEQIAAALEAGTITQEEADQLSEYGLKRLRKHHRPNRNVSAETNA